MDKELATKLALDLGAVFAMANDGEYKKASELLREVKNNIHSDEDIDAVATEAWRLSLAMFNSTEKIKHHLGLE